MPNNVNKHQPNLHNSAAHYYKDLQLAQLIKTTSDDTMPMMKATHVEVVIASLSPRLFHDHNPHLGLHGTSGSEDGTRGAGHDDDDELPLLSDAPAFPMTSSRPTINNVTN